MSEKSTGSGVSGGSNSGDEEQFDFKLRTIFISDIHLGTRGCQAEVLLDFLKHCNADTYYLVGDIVDGWRLKKSWYWPRAHNDVVQKLLRKARKGSRIVYVPGNHDEFLRHYFDLSFGDVEIKNNPIHVTADGKRYLVIHGDQYDNVMLYSRWLAFLGDNTYEMLLLLNGPINRVRRWFGLSHWSLSQYLKLKVKNAVNFISSFEHVVAADAKHHHVDGVVCGHIHHAEIRDIDGLTYCNDGDWVESCTALVEHMDGKMEIMNWLDHYNKRLLAERRTNEEPVQLKFG
ncbi:UDP-2,3-diacylglucosamine diphosphatase [Sapientia aquatica]|uniref:UDP-2,3-diacylglucosamine diphosphatase n=1 Tax=Sapientia aquatica TaxID=1549640 RepID=UPI00267FF833